MYYLVFFKSFSLYYSFLFVKSVWILHYLKSHLTHLILFFLVFSKLFGLYEFLKILHSFKEFYCLFFNVLCRFFCRTTRLILAQIIILCQHFFEIFFYFFWSFFKNFKNPLFLRVLEFGFLFKIIQKITFLILNIRK